MPRKRKEPKYTAARPGEAAGFLELGAIRPASQKLYRASLAGFMAWCTLMSLDWSSPESLDELLVFWADRMYFEGELVSTGNFLLAALQHHLPSVNAALPGPLTRFCRSLQGWRRMAPNRQRVPFPWLALMAVLGLLLEGRDVMMALY